ncbi:MULTISPECIES: hypothetical protein [unclassified Paracoccus (in: a-proteobacteria)]|uniref:hypothetical protein n=1 Tax=unclassified Paracoccus (in: a-proteobacteria) TaxID=2688777 RepID=UPI0016017324|nr:MULTISPECIES: hypothetical protein [unclassified Paracoccus (in: a-proteobacteria)]MBB1490814.1 hypothetical protein [Paracoccus sp. MC1854]MBB1497842.1 hypothetical protein [Paracoccus sp. MC1862]QQO45311.1 hypothetical protein JGR78_02760 [Paracoccus sp. MC1862]
MTPDPKDPTEPRHAVSDLKRGESTEIADEAALQNEYTGEVERDGIPANGTQPTEARGPDDVGA